MTASSVRTKPQARSPAKMPRPSSGAIRQACDACHSKKIRCTRPPGLTTGPCEKCIRERNECVFSPALKTGRPKKKSSGSESQNDPSSYTSSPLMPLGFAGSTSSYSTYQSSPEPTASSFQFLDFDNALSHVAYYPEGAQHDDDRSFEETIPTLTGPYDTDCRIMLKLERLGQLHGQILEKRRALVALFALQLPAGMALRADALHQLLGLACKIVSVHAWLMAAAERFMWCRRMMHCMTDESALVSFTNPIFTVLDIFLDTLCLVFPTRELTSAQQAASQMMDPDMFHTMGVLDPGPMLGLPAGVLQMAGADLSGSSVAEMFGYPAVEARNSVSEFVLVNMMQQQLGKCQHACTALVAISPVSHVSRGSQRMMEALLARYSSKLARLQSEVQRVGVATS